MPHLRSNPRLAISSLLFLALSVFALKPEVLRDHQSRPPDARFQEIGKSPVCTLSNLQGKVGMRKDHGFLAPDLLAAGTEAGRPKTRLGLEFIQFGDGANPCRLDLYSFRGRAPPSA